MQKGFGLIGILIMVGIIAVLGVGVLKPDYFGRNPFNPTNEEKSAIKQAEDAKNLPEGKNDETKDWKTYRNEEYGFEFRYPASFALEDGSLFVTVSNYKVYNTASPVYGINKDAAKIYNLRMLIIPNTKRPMSGASTPLSDLTIGSNIFKTSRISYDEYNILANYYLEKPNSADFIYFAHNSSTRDEAIRAHQGFLEYPEQEKLIQIILFTFKFIK